MFSFKLLIALLAITSVVSAQSGLGEAIQGAATSLGDTLGEVVTDDLKTVRPGGVTLPGMLNPVPFLQQLTGGRK